MLSDSFERMYVMLHPVTGKGGGHARLEQSRRRAKISLSVHGLPASSQAIRALLVSENPTEGILWDLGLIVKGRNGQGSLRLENVSFPGGLPFSCYHTLVLVTDWPEGELLMAGSLPQREPLLRWQLQQIISRYLTVPVHAPKTPQKKEALPLDTVVSPIQLDVSPLPQALETEDPIPNNSTIIALNLQPEPPIAEAPAPAPSTAAPDKIEALEELLEAIQHQAEEPVCPEAITPAPPPPIVPATLAAAPKARPPVRCPAPSNEPPVDGLQPIFWPDSISDLRVYFSTLPPCAPFDAPGWRFVKVGLPHGGPANYCMVGIQVRDYQVRQIAYAVPGSRDQMPPPGLSGYRWQTGRGGQGYWTLWQNVKAS